PLHPAGRRPLLGGRAGHAGRPVASARAPVRAPRGLHGGRPGVFRAGTRAPRRGRAYPRRIQGRGRAGRPAPRHPRRGAEAAVTLPALVLLGGLVLAAMSAAVGVAAAAVSQLELTRWVSYKLRGAGGAAGAGGDPGRVVGAADALPTLGRGGAAAAGPAPPARTPPPARGTPPLPRRAPLPPTR